MTIRSQLFALALGVVVPVFAFAVFVSMLLVEQDRETALRGAVEHARAMMTAVDAELRGSITTLHALSASRALEADDLRGFQANAARVLATQPTWLAVSLVLPTGEQVVHTSKPFGTRLPAVLYLSQIEHTVKTLRPVIGNVIITGTLTREPEIPLSVPVLRNGAVAYLLNAMVRPESFAALIREQHLPEGWISGIVDGSGQFVARTPSRPVGDLASERVRAQVRGAVEGWYRGLTVEGKDTYSAYRRSDFSRWSIGLGLPVETVQAAAWRTSWIVGIGALASAVIALAIAFLMGRRIAAPIRLLASAARSIGAGDPIVPERIGRVAEVAEVTGALQEAAIAIRERQEALAEQEIKFRAIVENGNDAIVLIEIETGRYVDCNRQMERLSGFTRQELLSKHAGDLVPDSHKPDVRNALESLKSAASLRGEIEMLTAKGATVPVEFSASVVSLGGRTFLTNFIRDISERKTAERRLTYLASFPEKNPNPIVEADLDGQVRYANAAALHLFPDVREKGPAHPWLSGWETLARSTREGSAGITKRVVTVGDRTFYQVLHLVAEEQVIRVYGVDITECRRAEEAVRISEERLAAIIGSAMDAIIAVDENQRVVLFNAAAEKIFRCTASEVIGKPLERFLPERFRTIHRSHIQAFGATGTTSRSMYSPKTIYALRSDGVEFPCEATISQASLGGQKLCTVILRDLSERRNAEQLQQLATRLLEVRDQERRHVAEELHESVSQYLAGAGMYLSSARNLEVTRNVDVQRLLDEGRALLSQCSSDLRTIAGVLHPTELESFGLTAAIQSHLSGLEERHGIEVDLDIPSDLARLPAEHELALFRVMEEALTTIRRRSGGKTVAVRVSCDESEISLEVIDTGCRGAIAEVPSSKDHAEGTGIQEMRERMRNLGGRLEIASGSSGTTIRAVLSFVPRQSETSHPRHRLS